MTTRILVTGSRDWPYPEVVYRELDKATRDIGGPVVIVEGAANGADEYAHQWVQRHYILGNDYVSSESHPADWAKYGKSAGFIRNQEMVDLGADLCIVFRFNHSKGTSDCMVRAANAGIPITVIDVERAETDGNHNQGQER